MGHNVSPMRYELGFYLPEDDILHSHPRENLRSYNSEMEGQCVGVKCMGWGVVN
jgi:hypothetical protein